MKLLKQAKDEVLYAIDFFSPKSMFNEWGLDGWMYGYKTWVRYSTFTVMYPILLVLCAVLTVYLLGICAPIVWLFNSKDRLIRKCPAWAQADVCEGLKTHD